MKVYALVGKSGTGKSYQAMNLCRNLDITAIIDDGLFIYENEIMAGVSAKRQSTKIGAIKTALFTDEEHCKDVKEKLEEISPKGILVLGTSDAMIERITARLGIPSAEDTIYIENITTALEREAAAKQRKMQGKHVIPVPTMQIKRQFSGYFVDPLRMLKEWGGNAGRSQERSVVRPTYSYMGDFIISDKVIADIISYIGNNTAGVVSVLRVFTMNTQTGTEITVLLIMKYGAKVVEIAKQLQVEIEERVESMTAFNVEAVNIEIRGLKK